MWVLKHVWQYKQKLRLQKTHKGKSQNCFFQMHILILHELIFRLAISQMKVTFQ